MPNNKLPKSVLEQAVQQIPDDALTVFGVARECNRHPNTVQRAIALGHLPAFKIGRQVLVWREDAEVWVAK